MVNFLKSFSFALPIVAAFCLADASLHEAGAANVPAGFTETLIPGPNAGNWTEAVGVTFSAAGRMFVWERPGRIWFRDPGETNFTQLLDISEEVGDWGDAGCLGFAVDPQFQVNGNIYLLYVVDRHHLMNFGTSNYNSSSNLYNQATISRLTRYSCTASNNFRSVNLASRSILVGETKTNGFPACSYVHLVGSLVFGQDGTLLVSCGDGASPETLDLGGAGLSSYAPQALSDGIIRTKEDVGCYRAQLVDCLAGKVLRIDPATGNGVPSNPFYDATKPRAAKSRVWTVGMRQPFRMTLRPDSGSHDPADANPGVLYVGEVGWDNTEALKVITGPGQNMGWPLFEGLELTPNFAGGGGNFNVDINNLDATNAQCGGYFSFRQLLKQDTSNPTNFPPFNNPCNSSVKIPTNIPQFLHRRPVLDWNHASALTRTPVYGSTGQAIATNIGVAGSPVSGAQFQGNCSVAGTWYTGNAFPTQYVNTYFHVDWGQGLIKNLTLTTNDKPVAVNTFATAGGKIVSLVQHPTDGSMYYVTYDLGDFGTLRRLTYTGNRTPVAVASADQNFGPGPLTVQFNGSGSSDPDGQPLTYSWNFGDGSAASTSANPSHIFTAPGSTLTNYTVTLTVTDSGSLSASATLNVAVNDTPPLATIISPTNNTLYTVTNTTSLNLTANVSDTESGDSQLAYLWQTILHHNNHSHLVGSATNHTSSTLLEPIGCDSVNIYYYSIRLTVTDPNGLVAVAESNLFPDCGATDTPPTITTISNQTTALNVPTAALPFTIGDAQVGAANLQLSGLSISNATLVPSNNIVFGGFGSNRTVTVTPAANFNGTAQIRIAVNDGPNTATTSFFLTVTGTNTAPTISALTNQSTAEGTPSPNAFTVGDQYTAPDNLFFSGSAANPALVPPGNIVFSGSGSNRIVTATPAPGQSGTTTITIVVSDGQLSASNSYMLTVSGLAPGTKSFTNATLINIPDNTVSSPYPSTINVAGLGGAVSNVTVTLRSVNHEWGRDVDMLLVSPGGQAMIVMSDAGTGPTAANANLTFSNNAASFLNQSNSLLSGIYKPTDYPPADTFPAPAPAGPYATNFTIFNGAAANGPWSLYVLDDGPGQTGSISAGWSLTITTQAAASSNNAPTINAISNQVTLVNTPTAAIPFTIGDVETAASNLVLAVFTSNAGLAPTNQIVLGGSGSSRTVMVTPASNQLGSATISLTVSDGILVASNSFVLTVNPASLTVTENSFSRSYGATNPALTGLIVGLQAGDNITANFSTTANTNSPVGVYAITFALSDPGNKLGNYVVTTNNGTLTVTNALLAVTAQSTNKVYGGTRTFAGTEL